MAIEWLEKAYKVSDGDPSDIPLLTELAGIFWDIADNAIAEKDLPKRLVILRQVDEYFVQADLSRLDPLFSTALLRYSYTMKDALLQWKPFRDRVINNLEERGEQVNQLLCGLLDK